MSLEKDLLEQLTIRYDALANNLLANQEVLGVLLQERLVRVGERFFNLRHVLRVDVARLPDRPCKVTLTMTDGTRTTFTGEEGSEELLQFLYASSVDVMNMGTGDETEEGGNN